jgi:catechol 2,3-dioxygenase-like lactoylglutathione lyase family enzyme
MHYRDTGPVPLGHLGVNVPDLSAAKAYYDRVMPLLDYEEFFSAPGEFAYRPVDGKPGTFIFFYPAQEAGDYSRHRDGLQHLAFIVRTRAAVHDVYDLVGESGGVVVHEPQEFPQYHSGYYATFWLDPFGHLLEAVCHREH